MIGGLTKICNTVLVPGVWNGYGMKHVALAYSSYINYSTLEDSHTHTRLIFLEIIMDGWVS